MKKLSKLSLLKNAEVLKDNEKKMISGGYSGSSICYWEHNPDWGCTRNPDQAYLLGEDYWCCNCSEAYRNCGAMGY